MLNSWRKKNSTENARKVETPRCKLTSMLKSVFFPLVVVQKQFFFEEFLHLSVEGFHFPSYREFRWIIYFFSIGVFPLFCFFPLTPTRQAILFSGGIIIFLQSQRKILPWLKLHPVCKLVAFQNLFSALNCHDESVLLLVVFFHGKTLFLAWSLRHRIFSLNQRSLFWRLYFG